MSLTVSFSQLRFTAIPCMQLMHWRISALRANIAFLIVHCAVDSKCSHKKSEGTDRRET